MVIFLLTVAVCLLFYFVTCSNKERPQKQNIFSSQGGYSFPPNMSDNQQIIISHMILAAKHKCLPDEVRGKFDRDLADIKFSDDDRFKLLATFTLLEQQEAKEYGIPPRNTPAGLMKKWTNEYLVVNYLMK